MGISMSSDEDKAIESLQRTIGTLSDNLDKLEKRTDAADAIAHEVNTEIKQVLEDLTSLVYGNEKFRLKGLNVRVEKLEDEVEKIIDDRRSERDKLRGIQIGLGITTVTGIGTLLAVVAEFLN
jgi:chromosome segregation ATPase